jgi:hypothetical protein
MVTKGEICMDSKEEVSDDDVEYNNLPCPPLILKTAETRGKRDLKVSDGRPE